MAVPSGSHKGWAYDPAGRLRAMYNGTEVFDFDADDMVVTANTTFNGTVNLAGSQTYADDVNLVLGTGNDVKIVYETADANANELLIEVPAGTATNVPVVVIGDTIVNDDLGQFDGIVSTTVAVMGSTATATGPALRFLKSRGTNSAPTVVTSADDMGSIDFYGAVATGEFVRGARILAEMTGTIATTRGPGVMTFQTATDAAPSVLTTAMTISAAQVIDFPAGDVSVGTSGTVTGKLRLDGVTSGTVVVSAGAVAGAWTMTLPAAVGSAGQQLTDAAGDGVCTWAAASLGAWKNDLGILDPDEALKAVISAPTHKFTYNKDAMPEGQSDGNGFEFAGIFAEEAPWAMYGERDGLRSGIAFSPINSFGYARAAIEALHNRLEKLEAK